MISVHPPPKKIAGGLRKDEEIEELGVITEARDVAGGQHTDEELEELGVTTKVRDMAEGLRTNITKAGSGAPYSMSTRPGGPARMRRWRGTGSSPRPGTWCKWPDLRNRWQA